MGLGNRGAIGTNINSPHVESMVGVEVSMENSFKVKYGWVDCRVREYFTQY